MIKIIFALTGILFGLFLHYIAREEIKPGKKYFVLAKRILFLLLIFILLYYSYSQALYFYFLPFLVIAIILFIFDLKLNKKMSKPFSVLNKALYFIYENKFLEIGNYLVFIIPYFLYDNPSFQLLIASILFLYGFPAGTLLRVK